MNRAVRLAGAMFGCLALSGLGTPAPAQTALVLPNTYGSTPAAGLVTATVSGWTVTIYDCLQVNQGNAPANDCAGSEVAISTTGNTLSLVFQNVNTANPLLTSTANTSYSDLSYTMSVQAPGNGDLQSASLTLTGSTNVSSDKQYVTAGISTYSGLTTSLANSPVLKTVSTAVTNSTGPLGVDIKDSGTQAQSGDLLTTNTATVTFKVPEPLSITVFAVGLLGLACTRRRPFGRWRISPLG